MLICFSSKKQKSIFYLSQKIKYFLAFLLKKMMYFYASCKILSIIVAGLLNPTQKQRCSYSYSYMDISVIFTGHYA